MKAATMVALSVVRLAVVTAVLLVEKMVVL